MFSSKKAAVGALPALPAPPADDAIAVAVERWAPLLNGLWVLDLKRSDPIFALIELMGAPWLIVKALKASGESVARRTLTFSAAGLRDVMETTGVMARRDESVWTWAAFMRAVPVGEPQPAALSLDADGKLLTLMQNVPKALAVASVLDVEGAGAEAALVFAVIVTDAEGKERLRLRRVFVRPKA